MSYACNFFPFLYHCRFKTFRNLVYLLVNYLNYTIFSYKTDNISNFLSFYIKFLDYLKTDVYPDNEIFYRVKSNFHAHFFVFECGVGCL